MSLLDLISLHPLDAHRYGVEIVDDYWVVAGPNGGYLAAITAHAGDVHLGARDDGPARQLRTLTTHFLRPPVVGPAEVSVSIEQLGRSVAWLRLQLHQEGRPVLLATGAWATARTGIERPRLAPPDAPTPEECPPFERVHEQVLNLHRQWEIRTPDPGVFQRGDGEPDLIWWIRPRVHSALTAPLVVAIADALPPPIFVAVTTPQGVPTIDLTVHTRAELAAVDWSPGDWVLARFATRHASGGFLEEDGAVWLRDGTLIGQSRQLALG